MEFERYSFWRQYFSVHRYNFATVLAALIRSRNAIIEMDRTKQVLRGTVVDIRSLRSGIRAAAPSDAYFKSWPAIARDVVSRRPEASGEFLWRFSDRRSGSGAWQVTPGVFDTTYPRDETFYVLEGEMTITDQNGDILILRAGN